MKHLWKRVLSVLVAATMVFSLAACGTKNQGENKTNPVSNQGGTTNNGGDTEGTGNKTDKGDPIELTVYSQLANFSGEQVGWLAYFAASREALRNAFMAFSISKEALRARVPAALLPASA